MTPRHTHGFDVQGFALWLTVVMVLTGLIFAKAVWPAEWPEGWSPLGLKQGASWEITIGPLDFQVVEWSDKSEVTYVKGGDGRYRALFFDRAPKEQCGKIWVDFGLLTAKGRIREWPRWAQAPDWREVKPRSEGCELPQRGVDA